MSLPKRRRSLTQDKIIDAKMTAIDMSQPNSAVRIDRLDIQRVRSAVLVKVGDVEYAIVSDDNYHFLDPYRKAMYKAPGFVFTPSGPTIAVGGSDRARKVAVGGKLGIIYAGPQDHSRSTTGVIADVLPRQLRIWHVYPQAALLCQRAAEAIARLANQAIAACGSFSIVLAGGTTPGAVYAELRRINTDWTAWQVYFGDERCLPPDHAERNSRMAFAVWLAHVCIPASQIHTIPAEFGPQEGARRYAATLEGAGRFDLVLLGLGEDGHTASLFPGKEWGQEATSPPVIAVFGAPKAPAERISMSALRLSNAQRVWFMVTGTSKRRAVGAWRRGANIPAAAIVPPDGIEVFTDESCYEDGNRGA